ncbi:MAG: hypothetical protein LWX07_00025 [Bacteroidetes bacterium]|nr:hypothetical protein [Bacteroidota bacterium]
MKKQNTIARVLLLLLPFLSAFMYGCERDDVVSYENNQLTLVGRYGGQGTYLNSFIMKIGSTDYSFLAAGNNGLQIFDVTNKSQPVPVVGYNITGFVEETYSCKFGNTPYVFIAGGSGGVSVLDMSDMNAAVLDTLLSVQGDYFNTVFADTSAKILYAGGNGKTMYLFDISNLPNVTKISQYQTFSIINKITVKNSIAYVVQDQGIDIVTVSNPQSPSRLSQGMSDHYAYDIAITGNIAAIANDNNGVLILDISNPSSPVQMSFLNTDDVAIAVAVDGNTVYVAEDDSGVEAFNISNPSNPSYIADYVTSGNAVGITQYSGYVFVSDNSDYLILQYP